jgi:hypothetical protein
MDAWIKSLWEESWNADWGTTQLIDAVWDLTNLADCGLVKHSEIDALLEKRLADGFNPFHKTQTTEHYPKKTRGWLGPESVAHENYVELR